MNRKTQFVTRAMIRYHNKTLTRDKYWFLESMSEDKVKALVKELSFQDTIDVLVDFKGKEYVIEACGEGLDTIDLNIMKLEKWHSRYGFDERDKPSRI